MEHREKSENHRRLVEAGVIKANAGLTPAEDAVIEAMSPEEVDTLVGLREKLGAAMRERAGTGTTRGAADDPFETSSNIVL